MHWYCDHSVLLFKFSIRFYGGISIYDTGVHEMSAWHGGIMTKLNYVRASVLTICLVQPINYRDRS